MPEGARSMHLSIPSAPLMIADIDGRCFPSDNPRRGREARRNSSVRDAEGSRNAEVRPGILGGGRVLSLLQGGAEVAEAVHDQLPRLYSGLTLHRLG